MATPSENAENVTETALDATITLTSNDLSIWGLFLEADLVVKFVMLMLIMASIWSWAIIFEKIRSIRREFQLADDLTEHRHHCYYITYICHYYSPLIFAILFKYLYLWSK